MDTNGYTIFYSGVKQNQRAASGVAILVDHKWKNKLEYYTYINERIIIARFQIERGYLCVIGVYALEEVRDNDSEIFYDDLQKKVKKYNKTDHLLILGDLTAKVHNSHIKNVVGAFGETHINNNGKLLREFATYNELKLTNTFYRKKHK